MQDSAGKLFLVPTPIGNLKDITFRAVEVLKSCDYVYAEDTRTSGILFKHYDIKTPLRSFHIHNEHTRVEEITNLIVEGKVIGLVSDAGTPGISDPGFLAVRACVDKDLRIEALPGATAFVPALVESGLPCEKFVFEGFLPQKKGRKTRLELLANENRTMIFYESPFRIVKALEEFKIHFGADRRISVSRELSKIYHQTVRGNVEEVKLYFETNTPKGEFVIIVEGRNDK
ncbi:MAG: 16S rRNA (cytidine(1402)-2'-O)-methyltransferase [Bacteroidia bacterium]|nr:16S rRNA (cytidine(1402)-2'-O)-methyltransferase [Bacteroidia bacterium]MCO5253529.1 16S rRNA (cytidine(1402)-2'-O)-methyltransferase [Bacteroidota bacterium]